MRCPGVPGTSLTSGTPWGSPYNDRYPLGWSVCDPRGLLGALCFFMADGKLLLGLIRGGQAWKRRSPFPLTASCSSPRCATPTRCPHGVTQRRGPGSCASTGGTLAASTASMSDFWHKLGCCVVEKPQPVSTSPPVLPFGAGPRGQRGLTAFFPLQKKRRRRIDRSMIGEPMNFVHLTHIGSGDMAAGEGLPMVPHAVGGWGSALGCWVSGLGDRWWFWGGRCWFWGGRVSQLGGGC